MSQDKKGYQRLLYIFLCFHTFFPDLGLRKCDLKKNVQTALYSFEKLFSEGRLAWITQSTIAGTHGKGNGWANCQTHQMSFPTLQLGVTPLRCQLGGLNHVIFFFFFLFEIALPFMCKSLCFSESPFPHGANGVGGGIYFMGFNLMMEGKSLCELWGTWCPFLPNGEERTKVTRWFLGFLLFFPLCGSAPAHCWAQGSPSACQPSANEGKCPSRTSLLICHMGVITLILSFRGSKWKAVKCSEIYEAPDRCKDFLFLWPLTLFWHWPNVILSFTS